VQYSTHLTNSIEQSSYSDASSGSSCQEIPLWNEKVHYHVHKSLSLDPTANQLNRVTPSHPASLWSIFKLSSHLHQGLPNGLFS